MFQTIILIILILMVLVLLYDFIPEFKDWLGRIKIGTVYDDEEWERSLERVISQWLSKGAPKVPKDEKSRLKLIKDIKNINVTSSVDYWQDASVLKASSSIDDESIQKNIDGLVGKYIDASTGNWKSQPKRIDCAMLSYELLMSPFTDNKAIAPAMDYVAELIRSLAEKYGSVPYNENESDVRFVDTVGMICPFLIKYAGVYGKPEYIDIAIKQIKTYHDYGLNGELNIPFHCYNERNKAPLGICGWGRGCAWWALGLTDSLKVLIDIKGHNSDKALILKYLIAVLDSLKKYQRRDGSFGRMIFCNSAEDSSAAAMLAYCYSFMWSLIQNDEYRTVAENVLGHLKGCTRRNGVIDYSQGDTRGIGFYSDSFTVMPAAQGFAVAAIYQGRF